MIYLAYFIGFVAVAGIVCLWFYETFLKSYEPKTYVKRQSANDLRALKRELIYKSAVENDENAVLVFYENHSKRKMKKLKVPVLQLPAYRVSSEERGLVVGVSGTGKTNFILAQIFDWMCRGNSLVVVDVKPEIFAILETNNIFEYMNYEPIIINPTDPFSDKYNLLDDVNFDDGLDEIISVLIPDNNADAVAFNEFARRVLKAIILYLNDKNGSVSLPASYEFITSYSRTKSMFDDLKASANDDVKMMINLALQSADNERFLSSGMNALTSALSFLNDKTIAEMTRTSDFSLNDVLKQKHRIIFLQFEQLSQDKTASLYATTVQHLIRLMIKNHRERDDVFIILDELTNSSAIPNLPYQFNLIRAYRMPAFMYVQTIASLYDMFGKEEAKHLINSCSLKICYRTNDYETAEQFSDICGEIEVEEITTTYNSEVRQNGNTYMKPHTTSNRKLAPLVSPTDILQLGAGRVVCVYRGKAGIVEIPQHWKHTPMTQRANFSTLREVRSNEKDLMQVFNDGKEIIE